MVNEPKDLDPDVCRSLLLLGIACIFLGLTELSDGNYSTMFFILGAYTLYKAILELTEHKIGFNFPNIYKVIIAVLIVIAVSIFSGAWVQSSIWGGFGANFGDNINALADAIIKVLEYLREINVIKGAM